MANWTWLPGKHRLRDRRWQTKYNAHKSFTSLPRKVTHITQSYTTNANRKNNGGYQSDTAYLLNKTYAELPPQSPFVPDSWQPVRQFLVHHGESKRAPWLEEVSRHCNSKLPDWFTVIQHA
jgi:hypothetical protein